MSDKVRGGLFNALGDIDGLTVLDAFAGSGALAFEAISRGAAHATIIEADKRAQTTIERNIEKLGVNDRVELVRAFAGSWSNRHPNDHFDLILLDPPYDNLQISDMEKLARHLSETGTVVVSWPGKIDRLNLKGLNLVASKLYGDAQLAFYKRT
jgi:16S rRNA (guanine966-N2)-methyltransferase